MKKREIVEKLNNMKPLELEKELAKTYTEARRERLMVEAKKNQNVAQIATKRKYIARILTILNSKDRD